MNRHLGSGFNVYRGLPYQKGYGLGGSFRRFFRWIVPIFKKHALPILKSTAKVIGNEALSSVSNISKDIINGNNIADSVQSRLNEAVDNLKTKAEDTLEGRGFEKKLKHKSTHSKYKGIKKKTKFQKFNIKEKIASKRYTDIFS